MVRTPREWCAASRPRPESPALEADRNGGDTTMMLGKDRNQRGAGAIGCLLLVAIVGCGLYAGFQLGMPKLRNRSFEDRLNESYIHFQKQPAESIRSKIIQIGSDFDIALTPDQVKVDITPAKLTIDVTYEKRIDLKVWQTTLPFSIHRSGPY
jgi:hypothetical protein